MNETPKLPTEITRYYQEVAEKGRLSVGPSQLEFAQQGGRASVLAASTRYHS